MYENVCKILLDNGVRLIYTTNRSIGNALGMFKNVYRTFHYEVSINEKVAYELALAGSISSKRTACIFSTEELYEALDPLMSSAYTGVVGGFVVLCMKDTEEEVTPLGPFSKLPVIISEYPDSLNRTIQYAYSISEKYQIPVIVQAEAKAESGERRAESGDQRSESKNSKFKIQNSKFVKDPARWAATPKFRFQLHKLLNEKTEKIREEFEQYEGNTKTIHGSRTGIITNKREFLEFYSEDTNVLYLSTVYPLPTNLVNTFIDGVEEVYVIEGEYPVIELQIPDTAKVKAEHIKESPKRPKPDETMYGFEVVRDKLGAASSINMAHGIKKLEPHRKILAITFEDHFFHSGMPAFVNTLYNNSAYVLLVLTNERGEEIGHILDGFGFHNYHHIYNVSEIENFKDREDLTVLFYRGIV
jgi:TPP-dependent indolepyruvate ferredoxin oxidoreductase alpha subunit